MEVITDTVTQLWDGYLWCLSFADKRTQSWPLMGSYTPTWILVFCYLAIVWIGPKIMKNREPFVLKTPLLLYNFILVAINFHIFYELLVCSTRLGYSYSCQNVHYGDDPDELRIAGAIWWFYFSKCVEWADTFFFILRKKNNQVSFLHVFHHATMFPIWWTGAMWTPGGQAFFGAMMNSFIHVVMYTYYGIAGLGPQFQKYLWWKKYLTTMQLVQFVVGMIHAAQSLYVGCPFPLWMQYSLIIYGGTILALFLNFYHKAYLKPKKPISKPSTNGTSNGKTAANGSAANGHVTEHVANGSGDYKKSQ